MKRLQKWGRKSMTEGAIAAREQGDSTYVFRMASSAQQIQSRYIEVIESERWKFVSPHEDQADPRRRWALTFSRKEQAEETPQIPT